MKPMSRVLFLIALFLTAHPVAEENKPYPKYADQIIRSFEKESVKEFKDFKLRSIGSGGGMAKDVEEIGVDFFAYRPATLDEARALEIVLTQKLVQKINENENIRPYLREYPFPVSRALVSVSFHKANGDYYTDGSVGYVFQVRNKIFYKGVEQGTEDHYSLHEEPYEEALKLVKK
jgi:hypothetical protein